MIYDITRELFAAEVYPGDPVPAKLAVMSLKKKEPDICQLTQITLGSHSGTHLDAPAHFYRNGKSAAEMDLEKCIGSCKVVAPDQKVTAAQIKEWLSDGTKRLLLKGSGEFDEAGARAMAESGLSCIGIEGLSVGSLSKPVAIHRILLGVEIAILEGLCLEKVPEGNYYLVALPLKMAGLDGSPVRAVLIKEAPDAGSDTQMPSKA